MASTTRNTSRISSEGDLKSSSSADVNFVETGQPLTISNGTFIRVPGENTYVPIDKYEGRHRYDPGYHWSEAEEKAIVRKIDLRICTWVCLTFFALQLDRANIVQAVSDNMITDLGMNTNNYNYGQMIFYLCFLSAELPSQLISKKLGPDRWIPVQMVSWSLVASCQAFLGGPTSFYVCRALLGLIEGGFIPDTILYLSYWYTSKELPRRLSYFWTAYQLTSIVGAFLATGLLSLRGVNGLAGWRWLFAVEGLITGLIGIATYFYMPPSPTQTASWFRGQDGWFTVDEEKIMVNRVLRDDPSKGDMHNRQAVTPKLLYRALGDWEMLPVYIIGLTFLTPTHPPTQYLTLILRENFGRFAVNMLTIPAYVLFIVNLLWVTWLSERINQRFLVGLTSQLWPLPLLIALELIPASADKWTKYVLATLLVGSPYTHAINVAITSRNAGSVRTRTVATALYNMCVQASSVYATNIYRDDDKPMYRKGNKILLGIVAWNIVAFVLAKLFYVWRNSVRERKWNSMTSEQQSSYLKSTMDTGNKLLTFRFAS